jgi:hypothetical protein
VLNLGDYPAVASKTGVAGDIETATPLSTDKNKLLRQINDSDSAARIMAVLAQMADEKKAGDRLAQKAAAMTKADWAYLADKMANARPTERQTLAGLVARAYGTRSVARDAMRDLGLWESTDPFHVAVRTKILDLKP